MAITRIQKLQAYRIFRDFEWDGLPDFGRYNLIYGWNGAGKTSLSTLFRSMQRRQSPESGAIEIVVDGKVITGTDFASEKLPPIRVFNRDFVDRNVFETPGHELPPVFYLGEDSSEKQQRILALQAQSDELSIDQKKVSARKAAATDELNAFCTAQARSIRNLLLGDSRYNNYEAPKFKELMRRLSSATALPALLETQQRMEAEEAVAGRPLPKLRVPSFGDLDLVSLTNKLSKELATTVVASTIQELVENPQVANWVERGLHLHSDGQTQCHFCQHELKPERLAALSAHFNDQFNAQQARLARLSAEVDSLRKVARTREIPERSALYPQFTEEYDLALKKLDQHSVYVETYLDSLSRAVEAKKTQPFTEIKLSDYLGLGHSENDSGFWSFVRLLMNGLSAIGVSSGFQAMESIAELVKKHNEHSENFENSAADARKALELDEGLKAFHEWSTRQRAVSALETEFKEVVERLRPLAGQITELQRSIRQHRQPAEELTRELAAYLGRDELRFETRDNGYTVMRGKVPAMHLSEGERTAIAFMYFLKTLEDSDFKLKSGVVVIDDPVSSLDANSLFCAFGYMKERTKEASQLFVLTHNFGFFRQVKNWFNFAGKLKGGLYKPETSKISHFYMLGMSVEDGQRSAYLRTLDSLLHEYESEYHYMFRLVKDGASMAPPTSLAEVYGLPNVARRLLESFLSFRVPGHAGNLKRQMEELVGEPAMMARVIRFLHTHSHMEQVSDPEHDISILSEAPAVLADLLRIVETNDKKHFDAMMALMDERGAEIPTAA
ncbi:ATP-binding protein [Pandoraea bronchicola]|uniref:DNA replication and repair protein RecF n=1 Tax=Pandoraea bronchicola TaxID=2508287 RepID=A0A5E5BPD5_9BURK|nr:AAA family ATPase [Pandoraea bronchicola]VVE88151.1 DNA replication and repair protein RecF [Pandoraea bronchicola]